ncbi:hypothetical protein D1J60_19575 [Streptomyces sp. W1SF4]|nr:hypothetical protein D1J60_19575 [Streptomyces sp. W1SF4]
MDRLLHLGRTLDDLDPPRWGPPAANATALVRKVHALRVVGAGVYEGADADAPMAPLRGAERLTAYRGIPKDSQAASFRLTSPVVSPRRCRRRGRSRPARTGTCRWLPCVPVYRNPGPLRARM